VKYVLAYVIVCAVWLVIGVAVGFGVLRRRIRRATRRVEALDKGSQLEVTGVHHFDTRAKTPVVRPRVKKPSGE
jgi:hypothetical protein